MGKKNKKRNDIKITPFHIDNEVTGSSILVEVDGLKIVLDLGLYQTQVRNLETIYKINNEKLALPLKEIDYVIFTSSHADHCSAGGFLGRSDIGFKGEAISTSLSQELIKLNVLDSAYLMKSECDNYNKKHNKDLKPLYSQTDAETFLSFLKGYGYYEKVYLNDRVYFQYLSNGHLSGDGSIYLTYEKNEYEKVRLLYTGDHNFGKKRKKPFTKVWDENVKVKPDVVITESTYGGETQILDKNPIDKLEEYIISEVVEKKHTFFIPCFAIHRSSELAYMLKVIWDRNEKIRNAGIPIYFAGVMMTRAHRIIGNPKYKEFYDEEWKNQDDLFEWDKIKFIDNFKTVQNKMVSQSPKIIVASGGMITSYSKYLLSCYVTQKNCSILFLGYQGLGTLGRKTLEHEHKTITIDGKPHIIRANILGKLEGLSGHADDKGLRGIFKVLDLHKLKKIIIIHGDNDRKQKLKEELELDLNKKNIEVVVPKPRHSIKV
ncbi:TPA: MBL fold metallo-hydrolase [Clostridium botulinum]|nr:MBL fold metallo-hydrolase [Clostridium botulinum]